MKYIILVFLMLLRNCKGLCHAGCSPHITLSCSFGSLDPCIQRTCKDHCQKDGGRQMIACYCRGSIEGPTSRTCFCGPSKTKGRRRFIKF